VTTYQQLQRNNRYLRNEVGGQVALGRDANNEIVVLALDSNGRLQLADTDVASSRAFGFLNDVSVINVPFEILKLSSSTNRLIVKYISFTGNGLGQLDIFIDTHKILTLRNSYSEQTKLATLAFELDIEQELICYTRNVSFNDEMNSYEVTVFYEEV
jgi:hypothetical protein